MRDRTKRGRSTPVGFSHLAKHTRDFVARGPSLRNAPGASLRVRANWGRVCAAAGTHPPRPCRIVRTRGRRVPPARTVQLSAAFLTCPAAQGGHRSRHNALAPPRHRAARALTLPRRPYPHKKDGQEEPLPSPVFSPNRYRPQSRHLPQSQRTLGSTPTSSCAREWAAAASSASSRRPSRRRPRRTRPGSGRTACTCAGRSRAQSSPCP